MEGLLQTQQSISPNDLNQLVQQAAQAQSQAQMTHLIQMVLFVIGGILLFLYLAYIYVISRKNKVREALAGIDVQLKKRADLIPNVLKIAQKFMKHEEKIFSEITKLRTEAMKQPIGTAKRFSTESQLQDAMKQLTISVENYPQLRSDATMLKVMETYGDVEDNIAASRRF